MSTPRPWTATPCPRAAARLRAAWTLAVLLLLVAPFAGFVLPASVLAHHTNIKMPFAKGATWRILQGYNGSSHQNNSSTWQYYYSLDLVRADGNTAGQRVLSPVDGTIRWIDESYGGMSINLGDGYAFAYFHTNLDPGLAAGQTIRQGQYLGTVAPPGAAGNGGTPHIHVTLWTTNDGGNWDRHAVPFTGDHRIDGYDFPDKGGSNQYLNTQVVSTNAEVGSAGTGTAPGVPTLVSPATGTTYGTAPRTVALDWNGVSGATEYQVVINDGNVTSPWTSATAWTTPSLGNGQYSWQVRARNSAGTGNLTVKWVFWIDNTGGVTPTPTPPSGTSLGMTLGATSGRVGSSVTVSGTGYGAGETIRLYLDSVSSAGQIAQTTANSSGAWSTTPTIPDATGGNHTIVGRGMTTDRRVAKTFKVTPYLNRTPYQGPPGTTINLTVQGFGASETVKVNFDAQSGPLLANVTTDAKGTGTATFKLPDATTGWHDYVGVGQTSGLTAWGALNIERRLTASPSSGAPGTSVTARAKGFLGNQGITIAWNKSSGSAGTTVCSGTTDGKGSFTCIFAIPQAGAGSYPLVATAGSASASVTVGVTGPPAVSVSPGSGPVGETISISAGGFGANETVNFTWDGSTTVWQARQTNASGAVTFPALVPSLGTGAHTLKARGVTSGKTASKTFTVVAGQPSNTSQIGPGTFAVTATEEDLIGGTTSNGHTITPTDNFVALPVCTRSSCPWAAVGGSRYVVECGDNCYVRVTNPANNRCMVAPIWDVGPWFTNDNWWDPATKRVLNNLATTKNVLPQGYTGADAARDGLDVGYGLSNGIGVSNVGYRVGNRAALDLADGTWMGIGFANGQGIGQVHVTVLWLTGEDHTAAAQACGQSVAPGTPSVSVSPTVGTVGSSVKFTGIGFKASEVVDLYLDATTTTPLGSATADGTGSFSGSITVPSAKAGTHKVFAKGRTSGTTAQTTFKVKPSLTLSPTSGLAGTTVSVTARGFGASEIVELRLDSSTGPSLLKMTANSTGTATGKFAIPTGVAAGAHNIYGKGLTTGVTATTGFRVNTPPNAATVSLSPTTGSPRSRLTANGTNFAANETVDLFWDAATTSGGSAAANSSGSVAVTVEVPLMPVGSHTVKLKGRTSGKSATATYTVVQSLTLSPTSGAGGTTITAKGRGWPANTAVNVYWNRTGTTTGTRVCAVTTSATGSFTCTFAAPDNPTGTYPMQAVAGSRTANASFQITGPSIASFDAGDGSGAVPATDETATATGTATPTATASASPSATETATATETAAPTATPTETAAPAQAPADTPTPTPERERRLQLSPRSGPAGTEVEVSGSGFAPGEQANLYVESTDGEPIAGFVVDEHGDFAGRIVIPDVETGNLLIAAKGETSGTKASRSFRVTRPRAERSTGSGEEPAADAGGDQGSTSDGADQPAPDAAPTAEPEPTEEAAPAEEPTPTEEPNPEPTPEPVPHDLVFLPVADTSVSAANPDAAQAPEEMGSLAAAGPDGDVAFITFQLEGIAGGTVVSAQLVLTDTGETGGATDTIGVLRDVWADESGWTYASAPVAGGAAAIAADGSAASAWLDPGVETAVDVTGTVGADGTITFVISGTSDATLLLGSRESGASPRLVVTVLDTGSGS